MHKQIRPYEENMQTAAGYATEDVRGVRGCDIFILITDTDGHGMYVELGIAIQSFLERGETRNLYRRRIYE